MEEQKRKLEQTQTKTQPAKTAPRIKKPKANCDYCLYFEQDEETGIAECQLNLDQDEMAQYLHRQSRDCPYFHMYDEYKLVHKQI